MLPEESSWLEVTRHSTASTDVPRSKDCGLEVTRHSTAWTDVPRSKRNFFISIPKKTVKLAAQRNRIKRLLREAVRQDPYFKKEGVVFEFKVKAAPEKPALFMVKSLFENIKKA